MMEIKYNKKEFLLPDSIDSMACYHAKIEDGIMKLTIHDCNHSIRLKNDLNNHEEINEALNKLGKLKEGISNLQTFIHNNYRLK